MFKTFLWAACATNLAVFPLGSDSSNLHISLSRQKRAVTSCAPAAPHVLWTRRITRIVWRVIGFALRWRRLSSTCVETTGSSTLVRVTWEELPVSWADLSEWHMRENASVSAQPLDTWVCGVWSPPATDSDDCLRAFCPWPALQLFSAHFCQHSFEEGVLERERVCVFGCCLCLLKNW